MPGIGTSVYDERTTSDLLSVLAETESLLGCASDGELGRDFRERRPFAGRSLSLSELLVPNHA